MPDVVLDYLSIISTTTQDMCHDSCLTCWETKAYKASFEVELGFGSDPHCI